MRIFATALGIALVLLQYRLWIGDQGLREVSRLQAQVDAQASANREQGERNRQLIAEVTDLKVGLTALEERARRRIETPSETFSPHKRLIPHGWCGNPTDEILERLVMTSFF